ncbi:MAG TPA: 2-C-methyl-D-erythritol 4-phosphate cytidylyltransferase [Chloroflexota bacterium]|nr:2-C-methyl-D-erythritol 4-phosphate cytidylyltransferase [Chloroflexota bacterium]
MLHTPSVGAIIVAAGSSRRMAGVDKLWIDLGGAPLLARTIEAIAAVPGLAQLVVVGAADTLRRVSALAHLPPWSGVQRWVAGGPTRQDSVYCGLQALDPCDLVLIHDGARPLITRPVIERGIAAALAHGAVIAATPVTDTIKAVDAQDAITATLDRGTLRAAQTPQIFAHDLLRAAYERVGPARAACTDDAGIVERAGVTVYTFSGEATNLKVSTPADVAIVRALWAIGREGTPA